MAPIPNLLRERERGICIDRKRSCNPSLVWRLAPVNYPSTSSLSCSTSLAFSDDGAQLVVGDESGKLNFLNATNFLDTTAAFDSGHTSGSILSVKFLPGSSNNRVVTSGSDRQVRLIDLNKQATRPFACHRARAKALAATGPDTFLAAGEDGTVRLFDLRSANRGHVGGRPGDVGGPQGVHSVLVEQRCERPNRGGLRVSINSLALCPQQPHLFVTGGGDPFARMYDMRKLAPQADASRPAWVSCYAPHHLLRPGYLSGITGFSSLGRVRHITGVAFAGAAGGQLLLSYSGDAVYGVDVRQHAMSHEQLDARLRWRAGGRAGERDGSGGGSGPGSARAGGPPAALGSPSEPVRAGAGVAVGSGTGGGAGEAIQAGASPAFRERRLASVALTNSVTMTISAGVAVQDVPSASPTAGSAAPGQGTETGALGHAVQAGAAAASSPSSSPTPDRRMRRLALFRYTLSPTRGEEQQQLQRPHIPPAGANPLATALGQQSHATASAARAAAGHTDELNSTSESDSQSDGSSSSSSSDGLSTAPQRQRQRRSSHGGPSGKRRRLQPGTTAPAAGNAGPTTSTAGAASPIRPGQWATGNSGMPPRPPAVGLLAAAAAAAFPPVGTPPRPATRPPGLPSGPSPAPVHTLNLRTSIESPANRLRSEGMGVVGAGAPATATTQAASPGAASRPPRGATASPAGAAAAAATPRTRTALPVGRGLAGELNAAAGGPGGSRSSASPPPGAGAGAGTAAGTGAAAAGGGLSQAGGRALHDHRSALGEVGPMDWAALPLPWGGRAAGFLPGAAGGIMGAVGAATATATGTAAVGRGAGGPGVPADPEDSSGPPSLVSSPEDSPRWQPPVRRGRMGAGAEAWGAGGGYGLLGGRRRLGWAGDAGFGRSGDQGGLGLGEEDGLSGGGHIRAFTGHKNIMTLKEVAWLEGDGRSGGYVASGSDDGHVLVWEWDTGRVVRMLPAPEHVLPTCLAVHPCDSVLAACGNGTVVQLWAPGGDSPPRIPRRAGAGPSLATAAAPAPAAGPGSEDAVTTSRPARSPTSDGMASGGGADGDQAQGREGLVHSRTGAGGREEVEEGGASEGGDMDGGEGAAEVDVEEVWLSPQQRALVHANRADVRRRRAEAEQAAVVGLGAGGGPFSSPLRAAWANFAMAVRERSGERQRVTPDGSPRAANSPRTRATPTRAGLAARPAPGTPAATAAGAGAGPDPAAAGEAGASPATPQWLGAGVMGTEGTPSRVLRLATSLERQQRREGSPEETIPAFGMTPPAGGLGPRLGFGGGEGDVGEEGGRGAAGADGMSPGACVLM